MSQRKKACFGRDQLQKHASNTQTSPNRHIKSACSLRFYWQHATYTVRCKVSPRTSADAGPRASSRVRPRNAHPRTSRLPRESALTFSASWTCCTSASCKRKKITIRKAKQIGAFTLTDETHTRIRSMRRQVQWS